MLNIIPLGAGVFILKMDKPFTDNIAKLSKAANISNLTIIRSMIDTGLRVLLEELEERK